MAKLFKIDGSGKASDVPSDSNGMAEQELEELLVANPEMTTGEKLFIIGRQVRTDAGKIMDLVGVNRAKELVVIELKRGMAPRDVIAQVLDYSSWLSSLSERRLEEIAQKHFQSVNAAFGSLSAAYKATFGKKPKGLIGGRTVSVLFANEFSPQVVRPAEYLSEQGVSIRCVEFRRHRGPSGEAYFNVETIVGDEDETYVAPEPAEKGRAGDSGYRREIVKRLVREFEDRYGDWSQSLPMERGGGFKAYRTKDWITQCAFVDWLHVDGTSLAVDLGMTYFGEEKAPVAKAYVHLFLRRQSKDLGKRMRALEKDKTLTEGFKWHEKDKKPGLQMETPLHEIGYESFERETTVFMERLMPIVEALMDSERWE